MVAFSELVEAAVPPWFSTGMEVCPKFLFVSKVQLFKIHFFALRSWRVTLFLFFLYYSWRTSSLGLDHICEQNFEQNRDPKAMSNLLTKWAVKKAKLAKWPLLRLRLTTK